MIQHLSGGNRPTFSDDLWTDGQWAMPLPIQPIERDRPGPCFAFLSFDFYKGFP